MIDYKNNQNNPYQSPEIFINEDFCNDEIELALPSDRIWAWLITNSLILIISFMMITFGVGEELGLYLPITIIYLIYNTFIMSIYGQTLGQKVMDIKVVTTEGENPGFVGYCLRRELLFILLLGLGISRFWLISPWFSLLFYLGIIIIMAIMLFRTKKHRTLQDWLANTIVIKAKPES